MTYGVRIWNPAGVLQMDENSFTMRVVLSQVVSIPAGSQKFQTFAVPGITASNASAILLPVGSFGSTDTQYEIEVINDAVRVYNYIRGYAGTITSSVSSMRLLVMRFS